MDPRADKVKLGLAFFGGCGVNNARLIAEQFDPARHEHVYQLVANTDAGQMNRHFPGDPNGNVEKWMADRDRLHLVQLGYEITRGMGAGADPDVGRRSAEENLDKIHSFLQRVNALVLVAGFGGGTGTGALPVVAEEARKMDIPQIAVITLPFMFEGRTRVDRADECRRKLLASVPTITIFNENIPDRERPVDEAWQEINESCLVPMLNVLRETILCVGEVINSDLNDWKASLRKGNYVFFGLAKAGPEKIAVEEIVNQLLGNPYQEKEIITQARVLNLRFHGRWLVSEIEGLSAGVRKKVDRKLGEGIEVHWALHAKTDDSERWVSLMAVAHDIPNGEQVAAAAEAPPKTTAVRKHASHFPPVTPAPVPPAPAVPVENRDPEAIPAALAVIEATVDGKPQELKVSLDVARRWHIVEKMHESDPLRSGLVDRVKHAIKIETGVDVEDPPAAKEIPVEIPHRQGLRNLMGNLAARLT